MKDDVLAELSTSFNVARFLSIDPSGRIRHMQIGDAKPSTVDSWQSALKRLLATTETVNVRTFSAANEQGNPFVYGISDAEHACDVVNEMLASGLYCIVNETIDIHDGGVSGVIDGGWVEFGPNDTPRLVEKPGVCTMPLDMATAILRVVYGADIVLPRHDDRRIEFSLHPQPVGLLGQRIIVWESGESQLVDGRSPVLTWPNNFSRFVGDKTFGLLVAWAIGLPVPRTLVIPRNVAPFSFGDVTGTGEHWLRTAPFESRPGLYTTVSGWTDPYALLAAEDHDATEIASVLYQDGVAAVASGSTFPIDGGRHRVEGVHGEGDRFMLGQASPENLSAEVQLRVEKILGETQDRLGLPVRLEWVQSADRVWVVQLHEVPVMAAQILEPGDRDHWLAFDPDDGLDELRALLERAKILRAGIELKKPVGWTSHVGDLLRRERIPARVVADGSPPNSN